MNLANLVVGHPEGGRALHDEGGWHTWADVRAGAAAAALALERAGVGPGDRVALAMPASAGFVAAYLGILAAGAVAVPVNPAVPAPELARELGAVSPAVVLGAAVAAGPLRDAAGALRHGVEVLVSDGGHGDWDEALGAARAAGAERLQPVPRGPDDVAVLLHTSGTAGSPKPAVLTHGAMAANLAQMQAVPGQSVLPDDVGLAVLPLFHVFGLNVALGLALATGAPLAVDDRFDPGAVLRLVRDLRVTMVVSVPAVFAQLVRYVDGDGGRDVGAAASVRQAVAGGAPLLPGLVEAVRDRLGVPLHQGYGLTEASPAVTTTLAGGSPAAGSVGRPLPGVEVRLVDEDGADVLAGDPGEIWVRGPNVFPGYWGDEPASAAVRAPGGWLRTGDVGVSGAAGDLFVVDRVKDLIIVSGFNVYPGEVERVVADMPGVADAAVVGRPDPVSGETVEALVVPADPAAPPTGGAVIEHCARYLARYKCPTTVRLVPAVPRNAGGEAVRRSVRGGGPGA